MTGTQAHTYSDHLMSASSVRGSANIAKRVHESLDTVFAALPTDEARQEFLALVDTLADETAEPATFRRWMRQHDGVR